MSLSNNAGPEEVFNYYLDYLLRLIAFFGLLERLFFAAFKDISATLERALVDRPLVLTCLAAVVRCFDDDFCDLIFSFYDFFGEEEVFAFDLLSFLDDLVLVALRRVVEDLIYSFSFFFFAANFSFFFASAINIKSVSKNHCRTLTFDFTFSNCCLSRASSCCHLSRLT